MLQNAFKNSFFQALFYLFAEASTNVISSPKWNACETHINVCCKKISDFYELFKFFSILLQQRVHVSSSSHTPCPAARPAHWGERTGCFLQCAIEKIRKLQCARKELNRNLIIQSAHYQPLELKVVIDLLTAIYVKNTLQHRDLKRHL